MDTCVGKAECREKEYVLVNNQPMEVPGFDPEPYFAWRIDGYKTKVGDVLLVTEHPDITFEQFMALIEGLHDPEGWPKCSACKRAFDDLCCIIDEKGNPGLFPKPISEYPRAMHKAIRAYRKASREASVAGVLCRIPSAYHDAGYNRIGWEYRRDYEREIYYTEAEAVHLPPGRPGCTYHHLYADVTIPSKAKEKIMKLSQNIMHLSKLLVQGGEDISAHTCEAMLEAYAAAGDTLSGRTLFVSPLRLMLAYKALCEEMKYCGRSDYDIKKLCAMRVILDLGELSKASGAVHTFARSGLLQGALEEAAKMHKDDPPAMVKMVWHILDVRTDPETYRKRTAPASEQGVKKLVEKLKPEEVAEYLNCVRVYPDDPDMQRIWAELSVPTKESLLEACRKKQLVQRRMSPFDHMENASRVKTMKMSVADFIKLLESKATESGKLELRVTDNGRHDRLYPLVLGRPVLRSTAEKMRYSVLWGIAIRSVSYIQAGIRPSADGYSAIRGVYHHPYGVSSRGIGEGPHCALVLDMGKHGQTWADDTPVPIFQTFFKDEYHEESRNVDALKNQYKIVTRDGDTDYMRCVALCISKRPVVGVASSLVPMLDDKSVFRYTCVRTGEVCHITVI